ncbi:MAG: DDE-type integrase/transposase/recombinase [Candidatus Binatia bacterium]
MPTQQQVDAVGFMRRAVEWFAARGVRIERIMTDNGSAYRSQAFRDFAQRSARGTFEHAVHAANQRQGQRFIQTMMRSGRMRAVPNVGLAATRSSRGSATTTNGVRTQR